MITARCSFVFALSVALLCHTFNLPVAEGQAKADDASIKVMSFNIRYGYAKDGENSWKYRDTLVLETINDFGPDLLGLQEAVGPQVDFLKEKLTQYTYLGKSRDQNPNGEQCGLLVRTDRFEVIDDGQFWLSSTPQEPFTKSWDSSLPRIATWAKLKDRRSNRELLFLNTHFDHRGSEARFQAARIIREFVESQPASLPLIVTGDFNCGFESKPYDKLVGSDRLTDTWLRYEGEKPTAEGTFNGFSGKDSGARIDWVLSSPDLTVHKASIVKFNRDGQYPSDHFPVTAVLKSTAKAK